MTLDISQHNVPIQLNKPPLMAQQWYQTFNSLIRSMSATSILPAQEAIIHKSWEF
jgi:hypothetical protein